MDFLFWFLVCTTYEIENFMTGKRRKKHVGCLKERKKEKEERENETENVNLNLNLNFESDSDSEKSKVMKKMNECYKIIKL